MLPSHSALLLGPTLLCLSACATTTFTSTWKAPDGQTINPAGKTVAAMFVSGDERNRHTAENALAKDLNARGARGVPAYSLLPNEVRDDAEDLLASLKKAGVSEVVIMRVVGKDQQPSFTQFSAAGTNTSETPGSSNAQGITDLRHFDTLVAVETSVYSLELNELMWSSTSRTTNPRDLDSLVNEVARATANEMVKQGLLARQ
jgi:hypothetical protein